MLFSLVVGVSVLTWTWLTRRGHAPAIDLSGDPVGSARGAYDRGELDTAILFARLALEENPNDRDALAVLVRALVYRSYNEFNRAVDRQLALDAIQRAVDRVPQNPELQALFAFALQADGQPNAAAEAALSALEVVPDLALARTALALAYGNVGAHEAALRESSRAVESSANDRVAQIDALRALAISYGDRGEYARAAQTVERAIALNPHLLLLHFERALYALQIGDTDAATVAYYQVLVYDPDNVKARFRLCELSSMMREHDAAVRYCTEVTQRAPGWADGWYQLGREYFLNGNFPEAQANLHRCSVLQVAQNVAISERRFECWYLQGQAAQINRDCAALIATYNEFRAMASLDEGLVQTWIYPPEGPPGCSS